MSATAADQSTEFPSVVLVVDDDADTGEMYQQALSAEGLWVTASPEDDALEYAVDLQPDAIVADTDVRRGSPGRELVRRLKSNLRLRDIPLVLVSSAGVVELRGVGADAVLQKPVNMPDLIERTKFLLERSQEARTRSTTVRASIAAVIGRAQRAVARAEELRRRCDR